MQLSLRLAAISKMVHGGNRLVDVGCDHGYLPVYLVLNKKIPSAIAMDVRKGPLLRAKEHVQQYGVSDYIELRLSDGLSAKGRRGRYLGDRRDGRPFDGTDPDRGKTGA